ncbi:hypothetical protein [Flavivirga eckloniae]|uniref:Uncharacterized protein n=1 Tax=Flavivirga eckloniae TaxID=1803846 RepID=A0A2K9PK19_9FLAO|nr:hypothetical protein [Flavivirga eckloniae]AUP77375.1 hypothetical protein C1H87_01020 [Flavivirga eckloniae]
MEKYRACYDILKHRIGTPEEYMAFKKKQAGEQFNDLYEYLTMNESLHYKATEEQSKHMLNELQKNKNVSLILAQNPSFPWGSSDYYHIFINNERPASDRRIVINVKSMDGMYQIAQAILGCAAISEINEFKVYVNSDPDEDSLKDDKIVIYYKRGAIINPESGLDATTNQIIEHISNAAVAFISELFPFYYIPHIGIGWGDETFEPSVVSFSMLRVKCILQILRFQESFPSFKDFYSGLKTTFFNVSIDPEKPWLMKQIVKDAC